MGMSMAFSELQPANTLASLDLLAPNEIFVVYNNTFDVIFIKLLSYLLRKYMCSYI